MKKYGFIHTAMQMLAVSAIGTWYFSRTQHALDVLTFRTLRRKFTATKMMAGLPIVMVTMRGAKSGKRRTAPLVHVQSDTDPGEFAVVASNWGLASYPAWCFNLRANPQAECTIDGVTRQYAVHEAEGEEYERYRAQALVTYIGFPKYYQRLADTRPIPIFVMRPTD